jgi:protein-L-isoaspartate(D-aspartate) O-methyltransferase
MQSGYLRSPQIIDAFGEIERIEFVLPEMELQAEADIPLPIGYGQTISQPATVAIMLELLDPQIGQKILDVGSGSGWTTALLSQIVGETGKVVALEIIDELRKRGKRNVNKFNFAKKEIVEFHNKDGNEGYQPEAPYDRILVSASSDIVPSALKEQLKIGGKMVIPIKNSLYSLQKKSKNDFYKEKYPGFSFVTLLSN